MLIAAAPLHETEAGVPLEEKARAASCAMVRLYVAGLPGVPKGFAQSV
jgi:hypothetical protein